MSDRSSTPGGAGGASAPPGVVILWLEKRAKNVTSVVSTLTLFFSPFDHHERLSVSPQAGHLQQARNCVHHPGGGRGVRGLGVDGGERRRGSGDWRWERRRCLAGERGGEKKREAMRAMDRGLRGGHGGSWWKGCAGGRWARGLGGGKRAARTSTCSPVSQDEMDGWSATRGARAPALLTLFLSRDHTQHHRAVGERLAARASEAGVDAVAWVRGPGQRFHGRAKAVLEGVRGGGVGLG